MGNTRFRELLDLIEKDPAGYRAEVERMRLEDPERFAALIDCMRQAVGAETWSRKRRHSSLNALVIGDVDALVAKGALKKTNAASAELARKMRARAKKV